MDIFFKYDKEGDETLLMRNSDIKITYPLKSFHDVIWHILSFFRFICGQKSARFRRWTLINSKGEVISFAHTIGKIFQFPFMENDGIHIGPCETSIDNRGKGYYPLMLNYIIHSMPNSNFYMIVDEYNISSIKGVLKTGFKPFAFGRRTRFLKRYIIVEHINEI
ncbi:hypothetical protein [Porphyromonas pogonae]|uniref:hypothetical protein n=1 Tax=Porphyromonas pogonae TaxID=867595 RepID=UPI002E778BD1|nr:hypothetical protein [Porphyromonas pogonae]